MKLPATASPTPPESLPHRHLLLLPHGPHQGTTTTRCGAFRVVVCMCVRARTVPSMSDAFVALVCVAVGVWRLSWALLLRPCKAVSHGVSLVALGGRADERGCATRDFPC